VARLITFPILYFVIGQDVSNGVLKYLLIEPVVSAYEYLSKVKDNGSWPVSSKITWLLQLINFILMSDVEAVAPPVAVAVNLN
jgi:hypothetical protein